ncbi:transporter substrate-binding domain-containing protein [Nocardioides flavescens]|uniref:Transporter substrate-binding domain-containing protein n=1 Tax=Nocardioides flavescens TaxID=2691959 RepID=A0A6L7F459_9ACTN|nr:transporter substrate-binding domain-containing protein [Nocardioides flavescens]
MDSLSPDLAPALAPTGTLRAVINLGNPVLAQGTPEAPRGVTVAIAEHLAERLGVPLSLVTVEGARHSLAALVDGEVDVAFLAREPAREAEVAFTAAYVVIEGVHVVAADSPLTSADEVDREGVRIAVKEGSAYDLYLTRTVQRAELVRGDVATEVYETQGLEVCAGVRQPMESYATEHGLRVLEPAFQQIQQAVALPRDADPETVAVVAAEVERLKADGSIARALSESGVAATVAPPAG